MNQTPGVIFFLLLLLSNAIAMIMLIGLSGASIWLWLSLRMAKRSLKTVNKNDHQVQLVFNSDGHERLERIKARLQLPDDVEVVDRAVKAYEEFVKLPNGTKFVGVLDLQGHRHMVGVD